MPVAASWTRVVPGLDGPQCRMVEPAVGFARHPFEPRPCLWIAAVEDEAPVRRQMLGDGPQDRLAGRPSSGRPGRRGRSGSRGRSDARAGRCAHRPRSSARALPGRRRAASSMAAAGSTPATCAVRAPAPRPVLRCRSPDREPSRRLPPASRRNRSRRASHCRGRRSRPAPDRRRDGRRRARSRACRCVPHLPPPCRALALPASGIGPRCAVAEGLPCRADLSIEISAKSAYASRAPARCRLCFPSSRASGDRLRPQDPRCPRL